MLASFGCTPSSLPSAASAVCIFGRDSLVGIIDSVANGSVANGSVANGSVTNGFVMTNLPPLTTETLWAILNNELSDEQTHQLVWHVLGYRYDPQAQSWLADDVDDDWAEKYPEPPAFIESRPATVKLTRSIPKENKQLLKTFLGFKGYSVDQLVPRLTRRATMANWLLSVMRTRNII